MLLRIRQERDKKGWTLKYVADCIGISVPTIHDIETGRRRPSYDVLVKLEDLFKLTHRQLFVVVDETHNLTSK